MSKEKNVVDYPNSIETRVALLERSIDGINDTLKEIKQDLKDMRKEMKSDFRWLLTIIGGLGFVMAHGFHWF